MLKSMNKPLHRVLCLLLGLAALPLTAVATPAYKPLRCDYYEQAGFLKSVGQARAYPLKGELLAGVVPHHLLAGSMIASFFQTAAAGQYETVVFVAPSHYPTENRVITALGGWQTPWGVLENDLSVTNSFLKNGQIGARADEANMQLDHAVTGLAPFVKYYLPDVKVSALLLGNRLEQERVEAVASALYALSRSKRLLVVASADFSHYLTPSQGRERDAITRKALEELDYRAIAGFDDKNVDSPQALTVFLRYMELSGVGGVTFLENASAEAFLGLPQGDPLYAQGITTYFTLAAVRGES